MNKIFKVIWDVASQQFVVTSELSRNKGKSASSTDKRIAPNALTLVVTAGLGALLGSSALAATSTAATTQEISGSTQSGGTTLETTITSANGNKVYIDTAEQGAVALGYNATTQAPGNNAYSSIAIGLNALAKGIQIDGSTATGAAIAIGDNASAREASLAVGSGANASAAQFASAFGTNSTASGDRSTALGINSRATQQWTVALGASSSATGPQAVAIGGQSISSQSSTVAIGSFTRATFHSAVAIGNSAAARNESATAIGRATTTYGKEGIAIGMSAKSGVASSTTESYYSGEKSIAIGSWASTLGYAAIAWE
ncbi:ESPR-type extended signal peptide-containing protein [Caviibacterium pharyngocola]|uniref:Adhesin n=1 Tax=Caviibacterium pharyngocola TaxID=28159 RepID=A0A2M8RYI5_9PAST|nr:ESPR-type extended signal peptide-containing protein [Caviibacterium pharyngocola]PJG83948.1 hypothetical protein CVP04_02320 [Caviibacterium pharyngocola]